VANSSKKGTDEAHENVEDRKAGMIDSILPGKPSTPPVAPPAQTSGGAQRNLGMFLSLLLGGALAAVLGFAMARYVVPEGWPFPGVAPEPDPLAIEIEAQGGRIAALETAGQQTATEVSSLQSDIRLEEMRGELRGEFGALQARIQELNNSISALDARLVAVEKLPQGTGTEAAEAAAAAYERELAQMRAMLDRELERIAEIQKDAQTLEANAAAASRAATGRAAMARVLTALDTGQPFDDALFDLGQTTGLDIPAALSSLAEAGAPTLAQLQDSFPDAAREALNASVRAAVEAGEMDRFTAFLRTQLGTRSLEPRAGDDPDAILSRAEEALRHGEIAAALAELDTLPGAGQTAMATWAGLARARLSALDASGALARQLNEN
jgi:hypothetical protein